MDTAYTTDQIEEAARQLGENGAALADEIIRADIQQLAEAQAAKDRELLELLKTRPKAQADELRLQLGETTFQRPNRATRRAMAKAARRHGRR